jgi:hypothetical protein
MDSPTARTAIRLAVIAKTEVDPVSGDAVVRAFPGRSLMISVLMFVVLLGGAGSALAWYFTTHAETAPPHSVRHTARPLALAIIGGTALVCVAISTVMIAPYWKNPVLMAGDRARRQLRLRSGQSIDVLGCKLAVERRERKLHNEINFDTYLFLGRPGHEKVDLLHGATMGRLNKIGQPLAATLGISFEVLRG